MLKLCKAIGLALLLGSLTNAQTGKGGQSLRWEGDGSPVFPFSCELQLISYTKTTGDVMVKLTLTHHLEAYLKATCDMVTITASPVRGLKYAGEETWQAAYKTGDSYSTVLHATVPDNDTLLRSKSFVRKPLRAF